MNPNRATSPAAIPTPVRAAAPKDLLEIMTLLNQLIRAENEHLRNGFPATSFQLHERKRELADDYAEMGEQVMASHRGMIAADASIQKRLVDASFELRALTEENMHLLEGALAATRRRIEAIVTSIRKAKDASKPYANYGGSLGAHFVNHSSRLKA